MSEAPEPVFVDDRLTWWAEHTPHAEAMTYLGRRWTWAQWNDRVRRAAGGLRELGVEHGDVVAFLDKNHPACVEISYAVATLGAAHAIINWRLAGDEIAYAVNDSGAKILFVGVELAPTIERIRDHLIGVERIITVTSDGADGDEYETWLVASQPIGRSDDADPEDTWLIMYSSGTTGRPKGVMLSQRNMLAHTMNAQGGWCFDPGDKSMVSMPLFHVGGSSYVMFGIHDGAPSVMTRDADGASLAAAIEAGANRTFLVPAVLAQVLQAGPEAIERFGRLKSYSYGAAPMPPPLLRAAMKAWPNTDFIQVYGLTEVCGVVINLLPEHHRDTAHPERLLSAGIPIPGVELKIIDPVSLVELAPCEAGEICLKTRQLMRGYLNRPEDTAKVMLDDGWFRTGDMGRIDDGGFVYIEDRIKDMIISGGENIYSSEVERVLAEHPSVLEAAVIGVPDERWGESVKAVVALKPGARASADELITFTRDRLAHFKCPRSVDLIDALPRNPSGKMLKRELRKQYWAGRSSVVV